MSSSVNPSKKRYLLFIIFLFILTASTAIGAVQPVKIGVLSLGSTDETIKQWQPTADWLKVQISNHTFVIIPMHTNDLSNAVINQKVDFVLTNPEHYALMHSRYGIKAIATLMPISGGHPTNKVGGVIFAKADKNDIKTIIDIKNKTIAVSDQKSFGGYTAQRWMLDKHKIGLNEPLSIRYVGLPEDKVVKAVLEGEAEVGFVRTGILESMAIQKTIALSDIKVINKIKNDTFPLLLSTALYPEWAFATATNTDTKLSKQIADALLHLTSDMHCANIGGYYGFTYPADYTDIEAMVVKTENPQYIQDFDIADVAKKYAIVIAPILLMLFSILAITAYRLSITNKKLRQALNINADLMLREALLESLNEGVLGVDKNKRCIFINHAALEMLGYTKEGMLGRNLSGLVFISQTEIKINHEDRFYRKNGSGFPVRFSSTPIIDKDDEPIGTVVVFQDITKQKEIEKAMAESEKEIHKLALVAASTDNAVIITDKNHAIEWTNETFTRITGYTLFEIAGKKPGQCLQGKNTNPETIKFMREKLDMGEGFFVEILNYRKNNEEYWASLNVKPIMDKSGKITNYFSMQSDITARKKAEDKLVIAMKKAEEASRVKSEFLANMSHEIRTPLNGIIGFIDLLQKENFFTHKERSYVSLIDKSAKDLLDIVNDILDFSKIEASKLELDPHAHNPISEYSSIVEMFNSLVYEKNIRLLTFVDPSMPSEIIADKTRIKQILTNLLANAIKFTPQNGTVSVRIEASDIGDRKYKITYTITDTGIGMDEETIDRLFNPFSQADTSTTREFGGTGLGLAISQNLANIMGSKIVVKSKKNVGSEFSLSIDVLASNESTSFKFPKELKIAILTKTFSDEIGLFLDYVQAFGISTSIIDNLETDTDDYDIIAIHIDEIQSMNIPFALIMQKLLIISHYNTRNADFTSILPQPFTPQKIFSTIYKIAKLGKPEEEQTYLLDKTTIIDGKVLVVDDHDVNRILMREILDGYSLSTVLATDGKEALEIYKNNGADFDLILMDIHMPKYDGIYGFENIREYENQNSLKQTPIVALSADAIAGKKELLLHMGFNDYLTKPINAKAFEEFLKKFFNYQPSDSYPKNNETKYDGVENEYFSSSKTAQALGISEASVIKSYSAFLKSGTDTLQKLRKAIDDAATSEIIALAHKLKGASANLRIDSIVSPSKIIEENAKDNNIQLLNDKFSQIEKVINILTETE